MSVNKKASGYFPRIFTPSELIAAVEQHGVDIDVDNDVSGQAGSKFNTIFIEVDGKGGRKQRVRPQIKFTGIPTVTKVKAFVLGDSENSRPSADKINIKVGLDAKYIDLSNNVQEYGRAMQVFCDAVKLKATDYSKNGKLLPTTAGWYFPAKTTYEKTSGVGVDGVPVKSAEALDTPTVAHTLKFTINGTDTKKPGMPVNADVTDMNGNELVMTDKNGQIVRFNVHTCHLFLMRDSNITGVADISSFSRTGQGRGVTANLTKKLYVIPGEFNAAAHDDEELEAWRRQRAANNNAEGKPETPMLVVESVNNTPASAPIAVPEGLGGFKLMTQRINGQ